MKVAANLRGSFEPLSLGVGVLIGCFLVSLTYVTVNKADILSSSMIVSDVSSAAADASSFVSSVESFSSPKKLEGERKPENEFIETRKNYSIESAMPGKKELSDSSIRSDSKNEGISSGCDPKSSRCAPDDGIGGANSAPTAVDRLQIPVSSKKPDAEEEMKPMCDTSNHRCDLCDIHGDIRIIGKDTSSVLLVNPSQSRRNESWQVKPYARKWDHGIMPKTKVVSVRSVNDYASAPQCSVGHTVPAIIFSMSGYMGNFFHDFTDVLVPLFQTARQFDGEVQLLIIGCNFPWISKYMPYLRRLTRYEIIDFDKDERVHCFKHAIVGLRVDRDMMIDPANSPMGYTMSDFRKFMRDTYGLDRDYALRVGEQPGRKPRMLIISRGHSRKFVNIDQIVGLAEEVGFEVVVFEAQFDLAEFSRIANSCDVMLGVHGAGLTNFVFLPTNAVLIQVVPFGRHEWISSTYFGNPTKGMGLKYLEYTIDVEESTLTELYPRDDPVFTDPKSIHKRGWFKMGEIYLDKQNVRLDLNRFRPVLVKALELLRV
ncbi:hypothetical protein Cni_G11588 [Canna indica]|uniref:Glycosyltransferase 61 catalytic domain-containing protein n=1 Tax=Canna indica TaxID=4628 RepID=A0AAQ3K831_9LILI|nr:hypothetical protein Cni_G11588 [Canna indica]